MKRYEVVDIKAFGDWASEDTSDDYPDWIRNVKWEVLIPENPHKTEYLNSVDFEGKKVKVFIEIDD